MEHTRTTPEQSVILKKIGYDVPDTRFYTVSNGDTMYTADTFNHNLRELAMSAPNLTDVATWLREVKEWHVSPQPNFDYIASQWVFEVFVLIGKDWKNVKGVGGFNTHDLALSAGVDFILTKLNEDA
jgi:hypothetical protein